jgi:hypothetical protein
MSKLATFISALRTGETRTTKALERLLKQRRSAQTQAVIAALRQPGALNRRLGAPIRSALNPPLSDDVISICIDKWPDTQKEEARKQIVWAINKGGSVQIRWGLKAGAGYDAKFKRSGKNVTITALSPRSSLHISGGEVYVAPAAPPH